jgi:pseudouridine-5'-phosphate glycosidase
LAAGRPVVSLESTVIAQGLPWPENLETARAVETAVRAAGAVPASIAVLGGTIRIGLSDTELVEVSRAAATEPGSKVASSAAGRTTGPEGSVMGPARHPLAKANRRDLAPILAAGRDAATTVSATLWIARRFALRPFVLATGGLGGVHREAAISFDISTDLDELARADGALIVCSGLKSILDLAATLESLETHGLLVAGYRTSELPGFLTRSSRLPLEHRVDSPGEAAALVRTHRGLGLPGAIVLTQPVPEAHALDDAAMQLALEAALADAKRRGITGKPLTPFLLDAIRHTTGGRSLQANCALLVANARLAAEVALELDGVRDPAASTGGAVPRLDRNDPQAIPVASAP